MPTPLRRGNRFAANEAREALEAYGVACATVCLAADLKSRTRRGRP